VVLDKSIIVEIPILKKEAWCLVVLIKKKEIFLLIKRDTVHKKKYKKVKII
jgi:hypothetical protein